MTQQTSGRGWTRRFGAAVAVAGLALTAAACGGGGGGGSNAGSSSKTFVMATQALPTDLDIKNFSGGTRPLMQVLDSMLFNYDVPDCGSAPSADALIGILADTWEYAADRKSISITLKDDIKSQYGNPLTSDDVAWSLERGRSLSPIAGFLSTASAHFAADEPITVVDEHTFTLNLDSATPVDLAMWTVPTFTIVDSVEAKKHVTDDDPYANKWLEQNSASFGPWAVEKFDAGNQITFKKNAGYPDATGNFTSVVLKQITSSSDQAQLLQAGSVNYARNLTWSQFADLKESGKATVYECSPVSRDWLILQMKDPNLSDVRVRQAISMAIDRDELVKGAYNGLAEPALNGSLDSFIPDGADVETTSFDVDAAKTLMEEAGKGDGFDLTLNYNATQPGSQVDQLAILIQNQLKAININVELNKLASGNDLQTAHSEGTYQAELWSSGSALPSSYFNAGLMQPGAPNTTWGYDDAAYTDLVNQLGAAEPGSADADAANVAIANKAMTDAIVVQLTSTPNIFAMSNNVTGVDGALGTVMIQPQPANLSTK